MAAPPPPIQVQGLWKRYGLPLAPYLRHAWQRFSQGADAPLAADLPWALQGIDLTVGAGETLGVIGRNGAGKSSLLKVLAGVSPPSHGLVEVTGTLFPMIELNAGIHMDLTGRENIRLLGSVMGLSPERIARCMPQIEAFCELGEWLERPVRMYSSGMLVRLGFAVGMHVESDILLMDEVMAVGDMAFQNKCLRQLEEVRGEGRSILFVSHNLLRVRRLCDRVLLLEKGCPLFLGHPEEAIARYEALVREGAVTRQQARGGFDYIGVSLVTAVVEGGDGTPVAAVAQGEPVTFRFTLRLERPQEQVNVNVVVESQEAVLVVWEEMELPALAAGEHRFVMEWPELRLKAGFYTLRVTMGVGPFSLKGFRASHPLAVTGAPGDMGVYRPRSRFVHLGPVHI